MKSQKEIVDELIALWTSGEKEFARSTLKLNKDHLSEKIYLYIYEKMGIVKDNGKIHQELLLLQKELGGEIFNQYGDKLQMNEPVEILTKNLWSNPEMYKKILEIS